MKSNALKKPVIQHETIQSLIAMRSSFETMKKRTQLLEDSIKATEQQIICMLEMGADVESDYELMIKTVERRFPHWKEHFAVLSAKQPGSPSTEEVLANTIPTVSKSIVIK